ncbi:ATP-dependent DNA ligase LigD phosphoesterase module /ATP-dependent DNA ligase LigD polymerase module [Duganella sacchari]|uniref:DNA ligase (ATP) n=1 Tax=Duganella sacchari TaxID=551987 RepID=A0A1M7R6S6_9BURK|nr:DNA ligase D [Duganella sacchari]SHN41842.1 ATP-dependent DNA ligase LigD phosphoesterase module /ATP-dependent DNA ligase LigD polymerase module [Duganella sacchari]
MKGSLKTYKAKRNFAITPEPAEGGEEGREALTFVIQKHWASRLHYDFRLELDGVMMSWAVPKGPSYDTHDKRMAVHVEDHPISYNDFEGTIPPKQYGAGKVIIWDKGTWRPLDDPRKALKAGNLKFEINGHKMHGRWVLVRMKGKGEKQEPWLLIKENDEYARSADEFSVVDEMPDSVKALPMPDAPGAPAAVSATAAPVDGAAAERAAPKAALPESLSPQLATLVDAPPSGPADWLFEVKFDGYRLLARIDGKDIRLITRNGNDWTHKLQPLRDELARLKFPSGWYDGEIVVHDDEGRPDFGLLQNAFDEDNPGNIVYFLFDLPFHNGHDLRDTPLEQRRAILEKVLVKRQTDNVRFSTALNAPPQDMIAAACQMGLEGIIGKRRDAPYSSRRNGAWIKLKCGLRQEFVIGGYTDPQGSRSGFGSLLLGTYDKDGKLHYAGNVGSGFTAASLNALKSRMDKLHADKSPFAPSREIDKKAHWLKPALVAEVSFGEWTHSGSIRHAVFKGLRKDKKASVIVREEPRHIKEEPVMQTALSSMKITNPDRVIDKESGATKIALIRYYALVADLMIPHLKGRPVSLVRAPEGVGGELFFQKHAEISRMPGVKQFKQSLDPAHPPMLEVPSEQALLSAAQMNVVELHTQNANGSSYEKPNRMVFDLDPGKGVTWRQVQEAAVLLRAFLDQLGLAAFLKTSGGKGLHVVVPVKPGYGWDDVKDFSQAIVAHMAETIPERLVLKSGPRNRVGKIFIDYLRNGRGATTVAAWSARTRPGLGISVPITWEELDSLHGADQWNVSNVHTRLDAGNAPWDDYAKSAKGLSAAMKLMKFKPGAS